MWLFTTSGFFSVVLGDAAEGGLDHDAVMIRSRDDRQLDQLRSRYPKQLKDYPTVTTADTDYPYRVVVPFRIWCEIMGGLTAELDYRNFKNQASKVQRQASGNGDPSYPSLLGQIWGVVADHYKGRRPK